jgi:sulfate transport system permease protein
MAGAAASRLGRGGSRNARVASRDPRWLRVTLVSVAMLFVGTFVALPLGLVFHQALKGGLGPYFAAVTDEETLHAMGLTALVVAVSVPLNVAFGIAAAWAIARFDFRGKSFLVTLIDLPFAVSPVVSGMVFVLLLGARGLLGPYLEPYGIKIIFATPGLILATSFVTFPFVARELIPFWQTQGAQEEEAAIILGASGLRVLRKVSLPAARYALLYGIVLASARAVGEFGAVSVVSGHIRGETNTLPLHIEILYGEYQMQAAFAVASLFALLGLVTLGLKWWLESKAREEREQTEKATATS